MNMSLMVFLAISPGKKVERAASSSCKIRWKSPCMVLTKSVSVYLLKMSILSGNLRLIDSMKCDRAVFLVDIMSWCCLTVCVYRKKDARQTVKGDLKDSGLSIRSSFLNWK